MQKKVFWSAVAVACIYLFFGLGFLFGFLLGFRLTGNVGLEIAEEYSLGSTLNGTVRLLIGSNESLLNSSLLTLQLLKEGSLVVQESKTLDAFLKGMIEPSEVISISQSCVVNESTNSSECVNSTTSSWVFSSEGVYARPVSFFFSHVLDEIGNYTLYYSLEGYETGVSRAFVVSDSQEEDGGEEEFSFGIQSTPGNLSGCTVIDTVGVYTQAANIVPPGNVSACINITVSNVEYNGNGFWISNDTHEEPAVYSYATSNVTVKNVNSTMARGVGFANQRTIYFSYVNNSFILNSTLRSNTYGIYAEYIDNVTIANTSIYNARLIHFYCLACNNTYILSINLSQATGNNLFAFTGYNSLLLGNRFEQGTSGIDINFYGENSVFKDSSFNSLSEIRFNGIYTNFTNLTIVRHSQLDVFSVNSSYSFLNISKNLGIGVRVRSSAYNNTFSSFEPYSYNRSYSFLTVDQYNNDTRVIDSYIANHSLLGNQFAMRNSTWGEVVFIPAINSTGGNLTTHFMFGNNSVSVNGSLAGLNVSANVTLYGIGNRGFTYPAIFRDGSLCTTCYNFTALDAATVVFNVSSWSNYSIGAGNDTIVPLVTIALPANVTYGSLPLRFNVTTSENATVVYSFDRGLLNYSMTVNASGTGFNATNASIADGSYVFSVYANDSAGNLNDTVNVTFSVDTTVPSVTIVSPTATTYTTASLVFNVSLNENGSVRYSLTGGLVNYSMSGNASGTGFNATNASIANGNYVFWAYANDTLGNTNYTTNVSFTVTVSTDSGGSNNGGGGGGGGGGSGGGSPSNKSNASEGASGSPPQVLAPPMEAGDSRTFEVGGEEHEVTVSSVSDEGASLLIDGTIQFAILIGGSIDVDLDDDGSKDVTITLLSVTNGRAILSIREYSSMEKQIPLSSRSNLFYSLFFVLILIEIIILVILIRRRLYVSKVSVSSPRVENR